MSVCVGNSTKSLLNLPDTNIESLDSFPNLSQVVSELDNTKNPRLSSHSFELLPSDVSAVFQKQRELLLPSFWIKNRRLF